MAMMNMEGEGISDVREYFRKQLVTLGVLKPTEEEAQQLAQMQQQAQQPTPEQQYLLSQAQKTLAEVEKIKAEAQKLATEYDPATVQLERDFETQKLVLENEKERMKVEIARLQADIAQVKALSDLESERERTRATIEAPQAEAPISPIIMVSNDGKTAEVIQPTVDAMSLVLAQTHDVINALKANQDALKRTKLIVRKSPDGSYVGERQEAE